MIFLLTSLDPNKVDKSIVDLNVNFASKDMRFLYYFLGIEVNYHYESIHLSLQKNICDLLHVESLVYSKPFITPMGSGFMLATIDGAMLSDATAYRKLVSSSQYLTLTKLNISFVVNSLCQFMVALTNSHWLSQTSFQGLTFTKLDGWTW